MGFGAVRALQDHLHPLELARLGVALPVPLDVARILQLGQCCADGELSLLAQRRQLPVVRLPAVRPRQQVREYAERLEREPAILNRRVVDRRVPPPPPYPDDHDLPPEPPNLLWSRLPIQIPRCS